MEYCGHFRCARLFAHMSDADGLAKKAHSAYLLAGSRREARTQSLGRNGGTIRFLKNQGYDGIGGRNGRASKLMSEPLSFIHRFEQGSDAAGKAFLLLHGTGGDENDLVPLGRMIAPAASLLSPRGKILENGMPRFFRRLAEGVFDEDDVRHRANELADFARDARQSYGLSELIAVGYSNGANIAAAMLLLRPETLDGAILLRAMAPLSQPPAVDLAGISVLVSSGATDPIIPPTKAAQLASLLQAAGAKVEHHTLPTGHQLSQADITLARKWLEPAGSLTPAAPPAHDR
jgi:phospholipase/carboxylesterase